MKPNLIRALYRLSSDWHSGQWSRGYRLLCRVYNYAQRHGVDVHRSTRASQRLYRQLESRYADKL